MMKLIAIITLIMTLLNMQAGQVQRKAEGQKRGIGTAAYHEPACGIGEAAEHVPGE